MTRRKASKDIQNRRAEKQESPQSCRARWVDHLLRIPKLLWAAVGVIATIITILTVYGLMPKVTIENSGSLRPHDPMGTVFHIVNESMFPISNVQVMCDIVELRSKGGGFMSGGGTVIPPDSFAPNLSPGKRMNAPCDSSVAMQDAYSAALTVRVAYTPFFWWRRETEFPMKAARSEDGTWIWKSIGS